MLGIDSITQAIINAITDLQDQTIEDAGAQAVNSASNCIYLDNATTAITATIADASTHAGRLFIVKAISEPAVGQNHTVTLTSGTWDGTKKVATFADINDALHVYFDTAGNGSIALNTGSVALS